MLGNILWCYSYRCVFCRYFQFWQVYFLFCLLFSEAFLWLFKSVQLFFEWLIVLKQLCIILRKVLNSQLKPTKSAIDLLDHKVFALLMIFYFGKELLSLLFPIWHDFLFLKGQIFYFGIHVPKGHLEFILFLI
jgi:hypothetical protein